MTEERHLPEDLQREAAEPRSPDRRRRVQAPDRGGRSASTAAGTRGRGPARRQPRHRLLLLGRAHRGTYTRVLPLGRGADRSLLRAAEPSSTFRWIEKSTAPGLAIVVDFLAPEDPEDPLAKAEGVRDLSDQTAADNTGTRLRPFPLRAGSIIDRDVEIMVVDIELVHRPGVRAEVQLRYAGPVGFLVAKANSFNGREDTKDGYDVSWWCLNAAPTAAEVAKLVTSRAAFHDPFVPEAIHMLQTAFKGPNYVGPTGYAQEIHPDLGPGDDTFEQDRNLAYSRVSEVIEYLRQAIDWDKLENGS